MLTKKERDKERYSRQIVLPEIGKEGQERLLDSPVAIIGCGATGGIIANNLVRAGVGRVTIIDRNVVELNNLQRQIIFDEKDIGTPKAIIVAEKLKKVNPKVKLEASVKDANYTNIEGVIKGKDLVLDGTDNMETRFLINDACIRNDIPWTFLQMSLLQGLYLLATLLVC